MEEPQPSGWFYRLSPRLILCARRQPPEVEASARILYLNSAGTFPPGHPTSRLCLDLLREALAAAQAPNLLDVGCGAGLISLAAAALGVPMVVGLDISPAAVQVTRENARDNALTGSLMVVRGSTECVRGSFGLIVANLPWEVQMDKVSELNRLATPGGRLILSGFRDNQENLLLEHYQNLGWLLRRRLIQEFRHPQLPPDISFTWVAWWLEEKTS